MSGRLRPDLRIELLGKFRVLAGAAVVDGGAWRLRSARGLIKLIALTPEHRLHRDRVVEALWPGRELAAASNNLRQALFVARRAIDSCGDNGLARIQHAHDVVSLTTDGLQIDVEEFEAAAAEATQTPSLRRLRTALALYGGELLPEDRFEDWTAARRQGLRDRYVTLLVDLALLHQEVGESAGALAALQRAIVEEPLHELAHRELMRIYALTGRRQRALAQFHLLRESLRREFEDEPDYETRRLYQDILVRRLGADERSEHAPAARRGGRARRQDNLPLQLTSFVGRDRDLVEVTGLARRHRLLTLTGPGGCGKTRLALELAASLLRDAAGGVWLVELAGLADAALVPSAVAAVLGVESRSTRPSERAVAAHVGERQMLIVLDNCEHLISGCARFVDGLLTRCPNLRILATSREPLHVAGEVDWRVSSLPTADAVRLFADRAIGISSRFVLSEKNSEAVVEICRRVDGIPLAIELAAARVAVLTPAQIAERLEDSLSVLSVGPRTALTRQQTLTATLDWSHRLLSDDERTLFRRLGAFAASFDLAAVEGVCGGGLAVLARLVDQCLVVVDEQDDVARYRLLETVRHYARQRLDEAGERADLAARHVTHYLALLEGSKPTVETPSARRRLARDADEFRWALRTALGTEPELALRVSAALWRFWHDRGDRTEGARWLRAALRAAPAPSDVRAEVLHGLSVLALRLGDHRESLETAEQAVAFFRERDDHRALAEELHHLGTVTWVFSDYDGAERLCEQSKTAAEQAGEPAILASVLHTLGVIAASRNDPASARGLIAQSVGLLRALPPEGEPILLPVARGYGRVPGDDSRWPRLFLEQTFVTAHRVRPGVAVAHATCDLAALARDAGEFSASRGLAEDALALFDGLGDEVGAAQALAMLGNIVSAGGGHDLARELHEESLAVREAANDARGIGLSHLAISVSAAHAADPERANASAQRALDLFERTDDGPGRAAAIMQLGHLAADAGALEEARALLQRAFELWRAFTVNTGWCPPLLVELAELDARLGQPENAPRRLRQAIEILEVIGDAPSLSRCEELLAEATRGQGQKRPDNPSITLRS